MNTSRRLLTWYVLGALVVALAFTGRTFWFTHSVTAQPYGITLPANVQSFSILNSNGTTASTVGDGQVATIHTPTPEFKGQFAPGVTSAAITVVNKQQVTSSTELADLNDLNAVRMSGDPLHITAPVDPTTGAFDAQVSSPLDQGTYFLYINDALVDEFNIAL